MLDNGGNMPWSQQATFLYSRSEQWMAPCAILSAHSILLESWHSPRVQRHVGLKHSLEQNEEQDLLWLQLNSCFQGRAGLYLSSVIIHMFKRAANYIATAGASFCCLRISKHLDTCDELIVPEIQEQPLLGLLFLQGQWPAFSKATFSFEFPTWGSCIFHLRFQEEDFAKMTLQKSWSGLLVLKHFS